MEADGAGDLAFRVRGLQLRVSAGLVPASPLSPPFRGSGHPVCVYSVVGEESTCKAVACQVAFGAHRLDHVPGAQAHAAKQRRSRDSD